MDAKERAELVRACRMEIKQRRNVSTPDDPRYRGRNMTDEARANAWLRSADPRRPRLRAGATQAETNTTRAAIRAHEQRPGRGGGFDAGERLRQLHESGRGFGVPASSEAHMNLVRRMNVRFQSRTGFSSANGVVTTLTPSERVNRVGVASRRRHVSPGLVPTGPRRRR